MRVLLPGSLAEAYEMLASAPEIVPMAGGTDLMVHWPVHLEAHEATYLDLTQLEELGRLQWRDDQLVLGALTTYWDVIRDHRAAEEFPLLIDAARQVGAVQIQARGTWAGNIANASPAADGVGVLMAYDAVVVVESKRGSAQIPLSEFYTGYKEMRLAPDELIREIRLSRRRYDFQHFVKVGARRAQAIAKVGVAVTRRDDGWRVVAISMAPVVCRCPAVEGRLTSDEPIDGPEGLLEAIRADLTPIDDLRSSARYRETVMARVLYFDVFSEAAGRTSSP
jgi:CO/xanthine dehydrogenase FAD-binding subunit